MDFRTELPPCLVTIMENQGLLKKHYTLVLSYIEKRLPNKYLSYAKEIAKILKLDTIPVNFDQEFDCSHVPKELCDDSCPLKNDFFEWLKQNTTKVLKTFDGNESTILTVYIQDKPIRINLSSDNVGRSFVSQIVGWFNKVIDLDLRRKADREKWNELLSFWVSMAEDTPYSKYAEIAEEDMVLIREIALEYINNLPVFPKSEWCGRGAFTEDGEYGYVLKEEVWKKVNTEIRRQVSMKKLSLCLSPLVTVERKMVGGRRRYFYKFKLNESQKKAYAEYVVKAIEKEKEIEEQSGEDEDEDFDIFEDWGDFYA